MRDPEVLDARAQALGDELRADRIRVRQHRDELLAAVAPEEVRRPAQALDHRLAHELEAGVAAEVAVLLVVCVVAVEIDHHEPEREMLAMRPAPLGLEQHHRVPAVRDAGQRVDADQPLEVFLLALERDDRIGQPLLVARAMARLVAIAQRATNSPEELARADRLRHHLRRAGEVDRIDVTLVADHDDHHARRVARQPMQPRQVGACELEHDQIDRGA